MIRKASKGGGALFSSPLTLLTCDAGSTPQTTGTQIGVLSTCQHTTPLNEEDEGDAQGWEAGAWELQEKEDLVLRSHPRQKDVSLDSKILLERLWQQAARPADTESTDAPKYIPEWVLPASVAQALVSAKQGMAPDLIYARGVPNVPHPENETFNKADCTLLLVEVGFCADLRCMKKKIEKTEKYQPLIAALLAEGWGRVELVCIPIGHAGTTLTSTAEELATALATMRPIGGKIPTTDHNALIHDRKIATQLLEQFSDLAIDRLEKILANRRREVAILVKGAPAPYAYKSSAPRTGNPLGGNE